VQFSCGILFAIATTVPALYIMQKYLISNSWGHRKILTSFLKVIITHAFRRAALQQAAFTNTAF